MANNNEHTFCKDLTRREFLKYGVYGGLATGLSSGLWVSGCRKQSRDGRPNVVVILIDTLRPDYLSFYGHKKVTAKFLAEISKQSLIFTRAFAPSSWTAPSTASLFTSRYPHRHGVVEGFFAHRSYVEQLRDKGEAKITLNSIPKAIPTLPEIFRSIGYETFGVSANINVSSEMGFDRGFDRFELISQATADEIYMWVKKYERKIKNARPYFLYLHPNDVHKPYHKREPYFEDQDNARDYLRASYISEIGYVDEYIERIYELLKPVDNMIFLVISDHGEEFWEHGGTGHDAKLYRELTQVLMLLHAPFLKFKPGHIEVNVSLIDVLPTLVEMVDGGGVQNAEGVSLRPLLKGDASAKALEDKLLNRVLFAHRIEDAITSPERYWGEDNPELQHWAAIYRNWNLIEHWDSRKELFDHKTDLVEQNDVFSKHPELTSRLHTELQNFKKQGLRKNAERTSTNLDENLLKTLKSLGYVE